MLFVDSADKAARFIQTCNAFNVPLLFLADVPGFMIGTAVERQGIIRHGAKMISAVSEATVPKLSVIVRKAYGAGLYAMAGPAFEPDCCIALPSASIAVMGPQAAVNAVFLNQIQAIEDEAEREAFVAAKREEYAADIDILHLASELVVDAVVDPAELRAELIRRFALRGEQGPRFRRAPQPGHPRLERLAHRLRFRLRPSRYRFDGGPRGSKPRYSPASPAPSRWSAWCWSPTGSTPRARSTRRLLVHFIGAAGVALLPRRRDLAHLGDPLPLLAMLAAVCAFALAVGRRREALAAVAVVAGANLTTQVLKVAPRAPALPVRARATDQPGPIAFPSGHATAAASIAIAFALRLAAAPGGRWRPPSAVCLRRRRRLLGDGPRLALPQRRRSAASSSPRAGASRCCRRACA